MRNEEIAKKMLNYSDGEIRMAEKYIKLAECVEDPTISAKLHDIAVIEMQHYDFFQQTAMKFIDGSEDKNAVFHDVYEDMKKDWRSKVMYKINNYTKPSPVPATRR